MDEFKLAIRATPRTFIEWQCSNESADRYTTYERIVLGDTAYYVNVNNKSIVIDCDSPLFSKIESFYLETLEANDECIVRDTLKIKLEEYDDTCSDGCCRTYGTVTTVNGVELPCHNQDAGTILQQVLEHLGYKVEMSYGYDE